MTLFPILGVVEISTPWSFRYPLLVKMSISIASSLRLSGTGMTSSELSDDSVSKFTSLVRARTNFPQSQPLMKDCQFGVSPVNYSDSDTIYEGKTKTLINFTLTVQLICDSVFAFAKSRFTNDAAHISIHFSEYNKQLRHITASNIGLG